MAPISRVIASVALATSTALCAQAAPRPVVMELFTSEGCSSCPPAESLAHELAQRSDVLPLSFHVDYWDGLGWRDRYSLTSATERQRRYGRLLHLTSIYTPQIVIDGTRDVVGSDRPSVMRAVAGQPQGVQIAFSRVDGSVRVAVGTADGAPPADVVCVGYLHEAMTHIGRGENSGRTMTESNIVRSVQTLGRFDGRAQEFLVDPRGLGDEVTDIAILVQSPGQGAIVGAATYRLR